MTFKTSATACAACKHQRRRCTADCPLAPHFRPEQPVVFKNAHKLFGVRNILRILEQVNPPLQTEAMRSIIYESNMRDRFPVHGCLGVIYELQYQIKQTEEELCNVLSRLVFYQQRQPEITLPAGELQLGMAVVQPANAEVTLFRQEGNPALPVPLYDDNGKDDADVVHVDNVFWVQETYGKNNGQASIIEEELIHDYDENYTFFGRIEDRQSYIDSKKENESSSESSQKDITQTLECITGNGLDSTELEVNKRYAKLSKLRRSELSMQLPKDVDGNNGGSESLFKSIYSTYAFEPLGRKFNY